jgi:hypothetical protein
MLAITLHKLYLHKSSVRLPILALAAAAATASAATVTSNNTATDIATPGGDFTELRLGKFNSSLGTLTGVTVTVNSLSYSGTFDITIPASQTILNTVNGRATLREASSNLLGFTDIGERIDAVVTFPQLGNLPLGFTSVAITTLQVISASSSNIDSSFWSAYTGTGDIIFELRSRPDVFLDGSGFSLDTEDFVVNADMTVTYTYTPVPEPSTYGMILGGLALAGAALRRRQKAAK